MDTEVESLANIKAMEGRNLDASVNGNTLVSGEKADGTFGVFNFFQGIKNFFKGISALGTLASGSRLPVTDSNGNVTYTTMNDINNYVVNNALADYVGKGKTIYPTENATNLNNINEVFKKAILVNKNTQNLPTSLPTLSTSAYGYVETVPLINDNNSRVKQELYISDNPDGTVWKQFHYIRFRVDGVWLGWQAVATRSDLKLTLEKTVTLAKGSNTITFATNYAYLLVASGNNYGQGICFVSQGYNASVVKGTILANKISFGSHEYSANKQMTVTNNGGGEIQLNIYCIG